MNSIRNSSFRRQRGLSSVLFLMISGLSLAAMVFGAAHHVRGSQAQSVTVHALTQAQLKAWGGAEALRQYLMQLGATDAAKLEPNQAVAFGGINGVSAKVSSALASDATNCGGGTRVGFDITGASGGANALLAAVFCIKGSGGSGGGGPKAAINIKGDLELSGDLKVIGGDKARVVVDGKVSGSGSLSGASFLYASSDVSLGGATGFETIFSEGSISLSGSGLYSSLSAMKDVKLVGGVQAGTIRANGKVTLEGNQVTELNAIGDVVLNGSSLGQLRTRGKVTASNANISGNASVQGSYAESSDGGVASGEHGVSPPKANKAKVNMTLVPGLQVTITPLTGTTISKPGFDAYAYKSLANYAFERDGENTMVTVRAVTGIADGTYHLAGAGDKRDYLCSTASYSASTCLAKICAGYSEWNSCLSYNNGSWAINGEGMAPGIVWFKGNLVAGQGTYYNSWIATGNLTTAANNVSYAVNYAGYAHVCNKAPYKSVAPSNFCKAGSSELQPVAAGNIVFGAGGKLNGSYSGGKINLSASNEVYGDVLAGDILETGGNTRIHGYVSAARLGSNAGNSHFGASTQIDLSNLPVTFKPGEDDAVAVIPATVHLLWSRYR
ncbi:MAG: hypothetical protein IV092_08405 [Burkholderiaceae bacterium]|nr:hypothetical protein [Burkholderiaceae bacterium]